MALIPDQPKVKTRTTPKRQATDKQYVIIDGAPKHYVPGYGVVSGGSIITLGEGVAPGIYMVEVAPSDAAKAGVSEDDAQRLAEAAAAKSDAKPANKTK